MKPNAASINQFLRENIMEKTVWDQCLNELKTDLSESQFNTWIRPLIYTRDEHSDTITLFAPNKFVVDWVEKNYLKKIRSIAQEAGGLTTSVSILVGEDRPDRPVDNSSVNTMKKVTGTPLNKLYTFENFVGGKSNQIASNLITLATNKIFKSIELIERRSSNFFHCVNRTVIDRSVWPVFTYKY